MARSASARSWARSFAEYSFAGLSGGDDGLRVKAGGRGDDDRFDGRIGEQVLLVERPAWAAQTGPPGARRAPVAGRPGRPGAHQGRGGPDSQRDEPTSIRRR